MVRIILAVILATLLTACGIGSGPNQTLVEKAIALQLSQTQAELIQQLYPYDSQAPQLTVEQVKITRKQPLKIQDLESYCVQGTYNLKLKSRDRQLTQRNNSFEVYLQQQAEGKIWRLARRHQTSETDGLWVTQLIEF